VFLAGRLVGHSGEQKNAVAIRFGNISLMADETEPIECGDRGKKEGFLVECRSLSGFSGSPVFVSTTQNYKYIPERKLRELRDEKDLAFPGEVVSYGGTFGPWLLGMTWGHIPLWVSVRDKDLKSEAPYKVEQNTGIACVAPTWKILEVLNSSRLASQRRQDDQKIAKLIKRENASIADASSDQ
jgi:hypothetical protein